MLVAGAAVGVATVFSAPFSGETLPRAPPLHPGVPTHLSCPLARSDCPPRSSALLKGLEEGWGESWSWCLLQFWRGHSHPRLGVGVGYIRQTWV